jgi:tetratricopeptide (TPR) repeat protein
MRRIGVLLSLAALVSCASGPPRVDERDRFPLDPREQLAGPFSDAVTRGWEALRSSDLPAAEQEFRSAGEGDPAARIGLISAWVLDGRSEEAVAACASALREGEPTTPLLVACAEARAARSDPAEALVLYDRALARAPGRQGLRERAEEIRGKAREALVASARQELQAGNWDAARDHANRAIAADPKNPQLRVLAAEVEQGAGDTAKALERYREALELGSAGPEVEAKIAQLALESGDEAAAVALFDALARRDPQYNDKAAEARLAFRVVNWPAPEREAAQSQRLTRADAAALVWWMVPEVREARVSTGVIASDVVSRRDSRAVTRALSLGLLDADPVTHRANPDAPITPGAASKMLLRLLDMVRPIGRKVPCLEGTAGVPRSSSEAILLASACGLITEERSEPTVSGPEFTRALDRIRGMVGSGENVARE